MSSTARPSWDGRRRLQGRQEQRSTARTGKIPRVPQEERTKKFKHQTNLDNATATRFAMVKDHEEKAAVWKGCKQRRSLMEATPSDPVLRGSVRKHEFPPIPPQQVKHEPAARPVELGGSIAVAKVKPWGLGPKVCLEAPNTLQWIHIRVPTSRNAKDQRSNSKRNKNSSI